MSAGALLTGMGIGVGFGVLSEYASLAIRTAKWKLIPAEWKSDAIAVIMQQIIDAEHDEVSGLSSKGAVDVISNFIDGTINLAWMIDESIASQMFVQMIQQSIAYAIHASHAGSIGTIGNVFSGSASLSSARTQAVNEGTNEFNSKLRAFLNASAGLNIPSLTSEVVKGANARLDDYVRQLISDAQSLIGEWNDLVLDYYRRYSTLAHQRYQNAVTMNEDVTTRAYSLLESVGTTHLTRINELLDTLDGAYNWYSAGFISSSELSEIALRVELERQASEQVYDEYEGEVLSAIDRGVGDWDSYVTVGFNDLTLMETEWKTLIANVLTPLFADVNAIIGVIVDIADATIEDVCAYRNIGKATTVKVTTTFEHSESTLIGCDAVGSYFDRE